LNDELTGVLSADYLHHRLAAELAATARSGRPLACVVIDVHIPARIDAKSVLRKIGELLLKGVRQEDVVCREDYLRFVILTPGVGHTGTALLVERLRIAFTDAYARANEAIRPWCSFGIADVDHGTHLLAHAESAAHQAERNGHNEIVIFDAEPVLAD
jgi:diguanylate cyclase (GGDEF)-like protein